MKKKWNKVTAALLMLVMVVTTVLGAAPALSVKAEPDTMGHLKSGSGNANGHFGSATPEAFVLSEKADYTNQAYSLKLRINSDVDKTRLRIVTKYKDDNNWAFLMYDVGSWKWQYKKDGNEAWQNDTLALPRLEKGQLAEIKLSYKDNGLEIDVNGTKATVTEANFVALKDVQGKVGVGGATFGDAYTDVYFNDVVVGETKEDLNTWKLYKDNLAGQEWDPAAQDVNGSRSGQALRTAEDIAMREQQDRRFCLTKIARSSRQTYLVCHLHRSTAETSVSSIHM